MVVVTTSDEVPGKKVVKILGITRGNTVRAKNIGRDIAAGFKNIVGGEVKSYTDLLVQARDEAYNRMVNEAIDMGADAIINMRFMTSMIAAGAAEILAYGTAVKLK
ncbi:MAG: YbjQ family protein [archaeon]